MKPRITVELTADGELEIWLNPEGRDALVAELLKLNERNEHFHLSPDEWSEICVSTRAYRTTDTIVDYGKVLLRMDEWDEKHYPHVLRADDNAG